MQHAIDNSPPVIYTLTLGAFCKGPFLFRATSGNWWWLEEEDVNLLFVPVRGTFTQTLPLLSFMHAISHSLDLSRFSLFLETSQLLQFLFNVFRWLWCKQVSMGIKSVKEVNAPFLMHCFVTNLRKDYTIILLQSCWRKDHKNREWFGFEGTFKTI